MRLHMMKSERLPAHDPARIVCICAGLLLSEGLTWALQGPDKKAPPPKTGTTVTARIPKEQLESEAKLKKLMDAGVDAFQQGHYEEAVLHFLETLDLAKTLDPKEQEYARTWTTNDALAKIGTSYLHLRQFEKAEATFARLLEFRKENLRYDSSVAAAYENLGVVDAMQGNFGGAEEHLLQGVAYLDECINHFKTSHDYEPRDFVANNDRKLKLRLLIEIASVAANQGKFGQANSALEEAFQTGDKFRVETKSLHEVVTTAVKIAELSGRKDNVEFWQKRELALQSRKDDSE